MSKVAYYRPDFTTAQAAGLAASLFGLESSFLKALPSERDQNFLLRTSEDAAYVLKISSAVEEVAVLDLQNQALRHLGERLDRDRLPRVLPTKDGKLIGEAAVPGGGRYLVRLLSYLPGEPLATFRPFSDALLADFGRFLAQMDAALADFSHPAAHRLLLWNVHHTARVIRRHREWVPGGEQRALLDHFLERIETHLQPQLPLLRQQVIHSDANDYNVLLAPDSERLAGLIDFGDLIHAPLANELAVALAYTMLSAEDPLAVARPMTAAYQAVLPLQETELALLYDLIAARLCTSVSMSAYQQRQEPEKAYLSISEAPAWELLERWASLGWQPVYEALCQAAGAGDGLSRQAVLKLRREYIGPSLSLSYSSPLQIVRGRGAFLYDENGRPFLDGVNNVAHVGHCHPQVVAAGQRQMAVLNTNTRYLHDYLVTYARRLCATLPDPLNVCYFVCSGSEANDLALRLARTHTGAHDVIVLDGAYHGNLSSLIEISPYKFDGAGGQGAPTHVHKLPMPDPYRGPYRGGSADAGRRYVVDAVQQLSTMSSRPAAFIGESVLGCGGQVVLPEGYFAGLYDWVRRAGGLCIADEVQVGFGRVGSHFWGFETQGVVPDIVTLGKPIGNGHPLAAVVTTPEVAASFNNGMEYFNTYGGNPVSCAVGLAVLDVIAEEGLQDNALQVGNYLMQGLRHLQADHALIGDVRGLGLFIGIELVRDRQSLEPAAAEAAVVVDAMKEHGILLSTDGPLHNVIKIKPPLVFSKENADMLLSALEKVLGDG